MPQCVLIRSHRHWEGGELVGSERGRTGTDAGARAELRSPARRGAARGQTWKGGCRDVLFEGRLQFFACGVLLRCAKDTGVSCAGHPLCAAALGGRQKDRTQGDDPWALWNDQTLSLPTEEIRTRHLTSYWQECKTIGTRRSLKETQTHRAEHRAIVIRCYYTHFWQISRVAGTRWLKGLAYPAPPACASTAAVPKNQAKQRFNAHPVLRQDHACVWHTSWQTHMTAHIEESPQMQTVIGCGRRILGIAKKHIIGWQRVVECFSTPCYIWDHKSGGPKNS